MNDRIPGTTYDNPIWHRGYRIWIADYRGMQFVNDDDPNVYGYCSTENECRAEIDHLERRP